MTDVTAEHVAQEVSDLLKLIAGPRRDGETVPQQMKRVGRLLRRTDISEARLWSLWYRPRDVMVRAHEADNIRATARDILAKRKHHAEMERDNDELRRRLRAAHEEQSAATRQGGAVARRGPDRDGVAVAGPVLRGGC